MQELLKIPPFAPTLAGDDGDFPAGANAWNGTPKAVDVPPALVAAGLAPKRQLPAQYFNAIIRDNARLAEIAFDAPVFNWRLEKAHRETATYVVPFEGMSLIHVTPSWIVANRNLDDTGLVSTRFLGQGLNLMADDDSSPGKDTFAITAISLAAAPFTFHYGGASSTEMLFIRTSSGAVTVATLPDGPLSTAGGGTVSTSPGSATVGAGCKLNGTWFVHNVVSTTFHYYFSSTLSGTWTHGSFTMSGSFGFPRRSVYKPESADEPELYVVLGGSTTFVMVRSLGGWNQYNLPSAPAGLKYSGAYNRHLKRFLIAGNDGGLTGAMFTAGENAATWTAFTVSNLPAYVVQDLIAFGRGFVAVSDATLYYITQQFDGTWKARALPLRSPSVSTNRWHLGVQRGRLIAARVSGPAGDENYLEWATSGCSPVDLDVPSGT